MSTAQTLAIGIIKVAFPLEDRTTCRNNAGGLVFGIPGVASTPTLQEIAVVVIGVIFSVGVSTNYSRGVRPSLTGGGVGITYPGLIGQVAD